MHGWKWLALLPIWVAVMNLDGISNLNSRFPFGEECALASVENVVSVGKIGDKMLFAITRPQLFNAGTLCPQGTLFLWNADDMAVLQAEERKQNKEKYELKKRMKEELERLGL